MTWVTTKRNTLIRQGKSGNLQVEVAIDDKQDGEQHHHHKHD
jgi:hypothetical protein